MLLIYGAINLLVAGAAVYLWGGAIIDAIRGTGEW